MYTHIHTHGQRDAVRVCMTVYACVFALNTQFILAMPEVFLEEASVEVQFSALLALSVASVT